jgi:predicted ATPase/DNA-binding winged helix-turn-helix (wHTH) protein
MRDDAFLVIARSREADSDPPAGLELVDLVKPAAAPAQTAISFGPFSLLPTRRLLLEAGRPVHLGSRALEILVALVERRGELVGKAELIARVWPDTVVEEGNLKVQVAALRRALGDGRGGNRYLVTIPGRGYRFVAPVTLTEAAPLPARTKRGHNLPVRVTSLVDRVDVIAHVVAQLPRQRFLTVVGPGGIGKTAIALATAERLVGSYEHGVWFVDLAPVVDPRLVPSAAAAALGLEICSENPLAGLIVALRHKRLLLVLDNCEHVIDAAAAFAAEVFKDLPGAHILATSREPLRVDGERVHRVSPLEGPPESAALGAAAALGFPAIQLFVERAAASVAAFELSDADAPIVAEICRRLDGLPLAIELAAARVDALGVRGIAARLGDCMRLLTGGKRTAPPRQQTMSATLDWSYGLLTEAGRTVLRRLAIFSGSFTLGAAAAVAADARHSEDEIVEQVSELTATSLLVADPGGVEPRFRLLETTRAYALEKLAASGERESLARRHAKYGRGPLEAAA